MSSISSIRLSGLATGMDTDAMVKSMLTADQEKIDKAQQKEQTVKWQQEIYREVMSDIIDFNDKYFSLTSKDSILSNSAWNTLSITSSNSSVISATGNAGATNVDYKFNVKKLAETAKAQSSIEGLKKESKLVSLGAKEGEQFKFELGKDDTGNTIYSSDITIEADDTIDTLITKINNSVDGKIKASYSEMTGKFTVETKDTGSNTEFKIVGEDGSSSKALDFLDLKTKNSSGNLVKFDENGAKGSNSEIEVSSKDGTFKKILSQESNTFTIDNIKYTVNSTGSAEITSKQDASSVVQKMKTFVDDYNKIMDKIYDLVTEKKDSDYSPLTEAQKEEMSEKEIENWEKKAKAGVLRNDNELRKFIEDMKGAVYGELEGLGISLSDIGINSVSDYNKPGQLSLDEEKFSKALKENGELVYKATTAGLEKIKKVTYNYAGSSGSVFAKKAGIEKTSTAANNLFSEQIKKQEERIKELKAKMQERQEELYAKFASLESSMNTLNSQMNYLINSMSS